MKTKPKGFFILNALGEMQLVRPGDLLAVRAPRHRARAARVLRPVGPLVSPTRFRAHPIDKHGEQLARVVTVRAAEVLGFWQ